MPLMPSRKPQAQSRDTLVIIVHFVVVFIIAVLVIVTVIIVDTLYVCDVLRKLTVSIPRDEIPSNKSS